MAEPFQPTKIDLDPFERLMALAVITEEDIKAAIAEWEDDPPDADYKLLLRAEVGEEDS